MGQNLNLGRESLISLAGKSISAISGFVGVIIFARVLGVTNFGELYFLIALGQILGQVSGGVSATVRKRISEVGSAPGEIFGFAHTANILLLTVLIPPIVLFRDYLPIPMGTPIQTLEVLGLFAVFVGSIGFFRICNQAYAGLGNPGKSVWVDTLRGIITLGTQLTFLYLGFGVKGLILGLSISSILVGGLLFTVIECRPRPPSWKVTKHMIQFSKWSVPNSLMTKAYKRADTLVIGAFVSASAVGQYEAALRIGMPALMFATSISNPLNVKVSARTSAGKGIIKDLQNTTSYVGALSIPMLFGGLALNTQIMRTVFGPGFASAGPLLVVVLLYHLVKTFMFPFASAISGADHPEYGTAARAGSFLIYLPAVYIGATQYGAIGVVGATVLTEAVMVGVYLYAAKRLFGEVVTPKPIISQIFASVMMYGAVRLFLRFLSVDGWLTLLSMIAGGAIVYGVILLGVSSHARTTATSVLRETTPVGN